MAQSFNPDTVWKPFGPFSQAVVAGAGKMVFIKRQVSLDRNGEIVGPHDMRQQVVQVLENIQNLLFAMNGRMSDIISLTQYSTNIKAFMAAGDLRKKYFAEPFPVTTTLEVSALYDPRLMIEITAIAEIPIERFRQPHEG